MTDYNVRVSVRNGNLLRRMRAAGLNQTSLAALAGMHHTQVNQLVLLKRKPTRADGSWSMYAQNIAAVLKKMPARRPVE